MVEDFGEGKILYFFTIMYHISEKLIQKYIPKFQSCLH